MTGSYPADVESIPDDVCLVCGRSGVCDCPDPEPTLGAILRAAPRLQWRKCHDCENLTVHVDCVGEWAKCRECGSMDTRIRTGLTDAMHQRFGE